MPTLMLFPIETKEEEDDYTPNKTDSSVALLDETTRLNETTCFHDESTCLDDNESTRFEASDDDNGNNNKDYCATTNLLGVSPTPAKFKRFATTPRNDDLDISTRPITRQQPQGSTQQTNKNNKENHNNDTNDSYHHYPHRGSSPPKIGPFETHYKQKYQRYVKSILNNHNHDSKLPNYRSMNLEQRQQEHQSIVTLFQRLGIPVRTALNHHYTSINHASSSKSLEQDQSNTGTTTVTTATLRNRQQNHHGDNEVHPYSPNDTTMLDDDSDDQNNNSTTMKDSLLPFESPSATALGISPNNHTNGNDRPNAFIYDSPSPNHLRTLPPFKSQSSIKKKLSASSTSCTKTQNKQKCDASSQQLAPQTRNRTFDYKSTISDHKKKSYNRSLEQSFDELSITRDSNNDSSSMALLSPQSPVNHKQKAHEQQQDSKRNADSNDDSTMIDTSNRICETSSALLPPPQQEESLLMKTSVALLSDHDNAPDDKEKRNLAYDDESSVEIPRKKASFESTPDASSFYQNCRRHRSSLLLDTTGNSKHRHHHSSLSSATSLYGHKGVNDSSSRRYYKKSTINNDRSKQDHGSDSESMDSPSQMICSSMESAKDYYDDDDRPFLASESPVPHRYSGPSPSHHHQHSLDSEDSNFQYNKQQLISPSRQQSQNQNHRDDHKERKSAFRKSRREYYSNSSDDSSFDSYHESPSCRLSHSKSHRGRAGPMARDDSVSSDSGRVPVQSRNHNDQYSSRNSHRDDMDNYRHNGPEDSALSKSDNDNARFNDYNDTLQTVDCSILQKRRVRWAKKKLNDTTGCEEGNDDDFIQDSLDISLRDGVLYRMKPLRVRRTHTKSKQSRSRRNKSPMPSFPDPLSPYPGTLGLKLHQVYEKLQRRDDQATTIFSNGENDKNDSCSNENKLHNHVGALVFSLSIKQIIGVTLKLLLTSRHDRHTLASASSKSILPKQSSRRNNQENMNVNGNTVIIVRDKNQIQRWKIALREGTSQSVLDHASMSASDRKRSSTARVCAGFDVVLTTFDALKAKDITTPLNELGFAVIQKVGYQDGWYSSRNGSSSQSQQQSQQRTSQSTSQSSSCGSSKSSRPQIQRCEQLSVLHQITWRRIIYVDILDSRRGYLSKPGTTRSKAACALNGSPRIVFFDHPSKKSIHEGGEGEKEVVTGLDKDRSKKKANGRNATTTAATRTPKPLEELMKNDRKAFRAMGPILRYNISAGREEDDLLIESIIDLHESSSSKQTSSDNRKHPKAKRSRR